MASKPPETPTGRERRAVVRGDVRVGSGRRTSSPPGTSTVSVRGWFTQQRVQQLRGMERSAAGEVLDLQAAGKARRDDDRIRISLADRGEESLFADEVRDFVMFLLVAEGASHAAAASV